MKKETNITVKVDKVLYLDFQKEAILAEIPMKTATEQAMKLFIEQKKRERK